MRWIARTLQAPCGVGCALGLWLAATAILVAMGCSSDSSTSAARPLELQYFAGDREAGGAEAVVFDEGDVGGPLEAGSYRSETFDPEMTFTVGDGWQLSNNQKHWVTLTRSIGDPFFGPAVRVSQLADGYLYDPNPSAQLPLEAFVEADDPSLAELEPFLWSFPFLGLAEPTPTTIGGLEGSVATHEVEPLPAYADCAGDTQCMVPLSHPPDQGTRVERQIIFWDGQVGKIWVVEDPSLGLLLIHAYTPTGPDQTVFLAAATELVESIEFT